MNNVGVETKGTNEKFHCYLGQVEIFNLKTK